MKNIETNAFKCRIIIFFVVGLATLAISGCPATIPESDTEPPEIRLEISGGGISRQVMTNPPRDIWTAPDGTQLFDLEPNTEYRFLFTVTDSGGVAHANIRIPDNFSFSDISDGAIEEIVGVSRRLTVRGSRDDSRTGLVIVGKFRTPDTERNNAISFTFEMEGTDFGGASGRRSNQRFMSVQASVNAR